MSAARTPPLALICGEDEFAVKQRAKQLYQQWCDELGGMDHETIEATVSNGGEALAAISRLREALQTLPFFGSGKVVWLRDCNFLGDERAASAQAVTETLAELAEELKTFSWQGVRLLISAGKVDKRKTFFKTLDKIGPVEHFSGWSADDKDWANRAEIGAHSAIRTRQKEISEEALADLVNRIGPNPRLLDNEIEKLCLFVGNRKQIEAGDVAAVCTRNKTARAFALGDALGDRDLPRLLRRLDEELWELKFNPQKSEIGLLYGLISKVRAMLLLKEMLREELDQTGNGLQPVQGAIGTRAGGQIAGGQAVQSAVAESLCALQGAAARQKIQPERTGPRHGFVAALQPASGVQRAG